MEPYTWHFNYLIWIRVGEWSLIRGILIILYEAPTWHFNYLMFGDLPPNPLN